MTASVEMKKIVSIVHAPVRSGIWVMKKSCEKLTFAENENRQDSEKVPSFLERNSMEKMQRLLLQRKSFESVKLSLPNLCEMPIYIGDRIVSRSQIYEPPIKFFTRKTSLANSHVVPTRLKPKGVVDALMETEEKGRA